MSSNVLYPEVFGGRDTILIFIWVLKTEKKEEILDEWWKKTYSIDSDRKVLMKLVNMKKAGM